MIHNGDENIEENDGNKENIFVNCPKRKAVAMLSPEAKRLKAEKDKLRYPSLPPEVKKANVLKNKEARHLQKEQNSMVFLSPLPFEPMESYPTAAREDCIVSKRSEDMIVNNSVVQDNSNG
jgi:replicative superfamily II helicase